MKQSAIVLNGNDVIKVSNLGRKYDKIMNNPNMKILEECDMEMLDERYNYWQKEESLVEDETTKIYRFRNAKSGHLILSINPDIEDLKMCHEDWSDYEKIN